MLPAPHGRLRERRSRSGSRDVVGDRTPQTSAAPPREVGEEVASQPEAKKTKKKTFMDRWVEPSLAAPKPSYREHGGSPYGVLEHMQALGEAPSARVKARVKADGARKGKVPGLLGLDAVETPEGTPAPLATPTADEEMLLLPPPVEIDDERDADFAPRGAKKRERSVRARTAKQRSEAAAPTPPPPAAAEKDPPPSPSRAARRGRPQTSSANVGEASRPARKFTADKMLTVVEASLKRATEQGNYAIASAVEEIYQQCLTDDRLWELLEAILTQSATPEQLSEFHKYVRAAKKKVAAKKERGDLPDTTANGSQRPQVDSPSTFTLQDKSKPARTSSKPIIPWNLMLLDKTLLKPKNSSDDPPGRMVDTPRKRSNSTDSDSSLTSMTSNEEEMDVDELEEPVEATAGPTREVSATRARDRPVERSSLAVPGRGIKRSSAEAELQDERERERERERMLAAKKQKLSQALEQDREYPESHVRQTIAQTAASRTRSHAAVAASSSDLDSPLSSPASSRHSTPPADKGPPKTFGRKAKIKQSPEKKNLSAYSGLAGVAARVGSPIRGDDNEELSENNDFCSACGASGFLLCCDGCDRSFHFSCLDPPLSENASELNEPWYCFICVAKRPILSETPEKPLRGLFAPLLTNLKKRNPATFSLPPEIRDYFEGVAADKQGNFIEAVHTRTRNRAGYDETPDYTRIKDSKGATVLCYSCSKSSQGSRPIIQCDYCGEHWHLDCLDPPLANPPARSNEGKKVHDWMCPLHADQELRKLDTSLLYPRRRIHIRKPRNARIVETALTRGFRNNGVIEVVDDESDDSDSEFYDEEAQDESVVYRLPASGIKLDFIDKVKNTRVQYLRNEKALGRARDVATAPRQLEQANFARRSFREKQMALNLAQFASANKDIDLGADQVQNLLGTLIAEAPADVVEEMTSAEDADSAFSSSSAIPPSPPSSEQTDQLSAAARRQLQMLQELIRRRLESSKT